MSGTVYLLNEETIPTMAKRTGMSEEYLQKMLNYDRDWGLQSKIYIQDEDTPPTVAGGKKCTCGQVLRQVGWQVNGGLHDGSLIGMLQVGDAMQAEYAAGGYSPVYVEVGTD